MILTDSVKELFEIARHRLGAPLRPVQLTDEQMCDLLKLAIGDYTEKVENWVIQSQWINLQGKNSLITNPSDVAYALTRRTMDWSRDFSYWFSREVGLQQRGDYELKKDFFYIEKGKQVYVIPAGREINKVLYITPSTTKAALYGNLGTLDGGFAGGYGQFGNMAANMGVVGFYVGNVYDTALLAADLKYKNSMLRGDLAYKVTAGPNGTHLVHLMSTPGSPNAMNGLAADDIAWGWNRYANCVCWYTYYDVGENATDEDVTKCLIENKDDVLITPDQVPMRKMEYDLLNVPAQQIVRKLFIAECMITLAMVRGYASGKVSIPVAEMQLDYSMFMDLGKQEKEKALEELTEWLKEMTPWAQLEHQANMNDQLMKTLTIKPLGLYWR